MSWAFILIEACVLKLPRMKSLVEVVFLVVLLYCFLVGLLKVLGQDDVSVLSDCLHASLAGDRHRGSGQLSLTSAHGTHCSIQEFDASIHV